MTRFRTSLLIIAISCVAALPLFAGAQIGDIGPIVPKPIQDCPANWNGLVSGFNNLIKFVLSFAVIIAILVIAYAGFLLVLTPTNPENRGTARGLLLNAAIGLVLALSAWLIVNTILITLTDGEDIGTFTGFIGGNGGGDCIEPKEGSPVSQGGGTLTGSNQSAIIGNEKIVRDTLAKNGISVNKNPCPAGVNYTSVAGGCTTVAGLRESTVQQVVNIKNICGPVMVTGGNELGHSSGHTNGDKVDLSTGIDSCIKGGSGGFFERSGSRGSDERYLDDCGNEYVREDDHWDVKVIKACTK